MKMTGQNHGPEGQSKNSERGSAAPRRRRVLAACERAAILGVEVDVYVLEDELRVISNRAMERALSGASDHGNFGRFLERILGDSSGFPVRPIFEFTPPWGGRPVHGIEVTSVAEAAAAITDMALAGNLHKARAHLLPRAREIEKALSKVALVALVDEATGYQSRRAPDALARKLAEYLLPEFGARDVAFHPEFFRQLARLYGVRLRNATERPVFFAQFIATYVYRAIDPQVARELRERNHEPAHGTNHHQLFTPRARRVLDAHLVRLTTVMRQSSRPDDFKMRFDAEFHGTGLQLSF